MHEKFVSLVVPVDHTDTLDSVRQFLIAVDEVIGGAFADFEVIIVNNGFSHNLHGFELKESIRRNCYVVDLAKGVSWDTAVLAGLERANGDYAVIFDTNFSDNIDIVGKMYETAEQGYDIVHLRNRGDMKTPTTLRREFFFAALRLSGNTKIHPRDRNEVLISRRVLNWIIRDSRGAWYLNEAIVSHGFHVFAMEARLPEKKYRRTFDDANKQAWATLVNSSSFLLIIAHIIIGLLAGLVALSGVGFAAIYLLEPAGKLAEHLAGYGWLLASLAASIGLLALSLLLYLQLRIQMLLLEEARPHQRYIVERFGRM